MMTDFSFLSELSL